MKAKITIEHKDPKEKIYTYEEMTKEYGIYTALGYNESVFLVAIYGGVLHIDANIGTIAIVSKINGWGKHTFVRANVALDIKIQ